MHTVASSQRIWESTPRNPGGRVGSVGVIRSVPRRSAARRRGRPTPRKIAGTMTAARIRAIT